MVGIPFDMTRSKTTNRRQFLNAAAVTAAMTNENGPALAWRAPFPGKFRALFSSGKETPATIPLRGEENTETCSTVHVARGETRVTRCIRMIHAIDCFPK
jgi:hypothetical protein